MIFVRQYKGVHRGLSMYWQTYGGLSAALKSPFLHVAVVLTLVCSPIWWQGAWWERSLSIIPSILGFSIAGFTLLLGVGDETFRLHLAARRLGEKTSTLSNSSAGFFHFIFVQVVAITLALVASSRPLTAVLAASGLSFEMLPQYLRFFMTVMSKAMRGIGFLALAYTLTTAVAATLKVFRLALIFSDYATKKMVRRAALSNRPMEELEGGAAPESRLTKPSMGDVPEAPKVDVKESRASDKSSRGGGAPKGGGERKKRKSRHGKR